MKDCDQCSGCGQCGYICRFCGRDMKNTIELLGKDAWAIHLSMHRKKEIEKLFAEVIHELEFGAVVVANLLNGQDAHRVVRWKELANRCEKEIEHGG